MVTQVKRVEIPSALEPVRLPPLPDNPLVSVLMANYNYASFIGRAIESVLNQTYKNLELVISDDASTDSSCDVIETYAAKDGRVRLVRGQVNRGHTAALNLGYPVSRGQIICFLDSDDVYIPDKIEKVVNRLKEKSNAGLVLNRLLSVDMDGNPIQEIPFMTTFAEGWIAEQLLRNNGDWPVTPFCGINLRREVADLMFPVPVDLRCPGNTGGLFRVVPPLLTEVTGINEPLYRYRIHGQNIYGAMSLTVERLSRDRSSLEWVDSLARHILSQLGAPERAVNLLGSLQYVRWTFEQSLLMGNPRRQLAGALITLARRILADDESQITRKMVRLTTYSVAVLLPVQLRARWLNWALGRNAAKQALSKLLGTLSTLRFRDARRLRQGDVS